MFAFIKQKRVEETALLSGKNGINFILQDIQDYSEFDYNKNTDTKESKNIIRKWTFMMIELTPGLLSDV